MKGFTFSSLHGNACLYKQACRSNQRQEYCYMEVCLYYAQERMECEISTVRVTAMRVQFHIR